MKKVFYLVLLLIHASLFAQELNLKPGSEFDMKNEYQFKGPDLQTADYVFHFRVLAKDSLNNYRIACSLQYAKGEMGNFGSYDSENIRKTTLNSSYPLLVMALLQKEFEIVISSKGQVKTVEGVDDIIKQASAKWQLYKAREEEMLNNSKNFPVRFIKGFFFDAPEKNIGFGSEWNSTDTSTAYKVTSIKGALLDIKFENLKKDPQSEIKGTMVLNTVTGLIELSDRYRKAVLNNPEAMVKSQAIAETWKQKLISTPQKYSPDTTWINMAVSISSWSSGLKNNVEYDKAKVYAFFKQNDARYERDPYYILHKLTLFQWVKEYEDYSRALHKTPNYLITETPHHLHNKIGDELKISADSAYAVAKCFYKTESFYGWVQHSFAQSFLDRLTDVNRQAEMRKAMKKKGYSDEKIDSIMLSSQSELNNSYKLLELLNKDTDPSMQLRVKPLYFWIKAKQTSDAAGLVKLSKSIKKLNDDYFSDGNAGRYELLIYQLLKMKGEHDEAKSLLNQAIESLEKFTADTLNKSRFAHQNLLAGAYYFKYTEEKESDPNLALAYLSKAAAYSPKKATEKAYDSFYDRVFLNTKESYRKEFVEALFKSGKNDDAISIFAAHINANPEEIDEMKTIFQSNFPDKKFSDFISKQLIATWELAPDFTLKGLQGNEYSLKDFKNGWLVLDFWGTWCDPCRREMPAINSFNKDLDAGKLPNVKFLSVACRDNESNVSTYFKANGFNIPAAMSDNLVQEKYKITGYPSKIIVSPTGRMLPVKFGSNWQKVIASFVNNWQSEGNALDKKDAVSGN